MKIRFFKLALAAVLLGGMISCVQEEPTRVPAKMDLENADELGASPLTFSNRAETKTVNFTADGDWYIRIPKECDWLTVSPKEGTGDAAVTFTSTLYEEDVPRSANVYFVVDGIEQKDFLQVTQLQKFYLEPSVLSNVLPKTGGEAVVSVNTNGTFTCSVDAAGASWLSVVSQDRNEVIINAKAMADNAVKNTAVLTLTCVEDPGLTASLNLSQKNLQVVINAKEIIADGCAGSGELSVSTLNVKDWKVETDVPWIKAEKSGDKILFTVEANSTSLDRTGLISAICADSADDADVKGVITVNQYPAADLLDFKFNEDGTAEDVSPRKNAVNSWLGEGVMNYYEEYKSWGPTVNRGQNKSYDKTTGFWESDYTAYENSVADSYTIESVFTLNTAHTNVETKAFGATQGGGFALMLGSAAGLTTNKGDSSTTTRDGSIEFIQHNGAGWNFAVSHVQVVPGQLYHVFGVWDGKDIKCYVDGELKATVGANGFKHKGGNHYMGVAGNYSSDTKFNGSWSGTVVVARLYDTPLTAEQIAAKTSLKGTIKIVK